jgi:hypothetical protein
MKTRLLLCLTALLLSCGGNSAPDMLLIAPFHDGLSPLQDDPDTLREAMRPVVQSLRMLPRNVTAASDLREAVLETPPDLIWLRGGREFDTWIGRLPKSWHGLVLRTLPPARPAGPDRTADAGPFNLLYAPPARSDRHYAAYAKRLIQALDEGQSLADANATAAQDGPRWKLLGDPNWTLAGRETSPRVNPSKKVPPSED